MKPLYASKIVYDITIVKIVKNPPDEEKKLRLLTALLLSGTSLLKSALNNHSLKCHITI